MRFARFVPPIVGLLAVTVVEAGAAMLSSGAWAAPTATPTATCVIEYAMGEDIQASYRPSPGLLLSQTAEATGSGRGFLIASADRTGRTFRGGGVAVERAGYAGAYSASNAGNAIPIAPAQIISTSPRISMSGTVHNAGIARCGMASSIPILRVSDGHDWPDATDTGVPAGTDLVPYTGPNVITVDGTVIENKIIDSYIEVRARNVTIRNCKIDFDGWHAIYAYEGADGLTVERCTITGQGKTGGSYGIDTSDTFASTLIGNNISGYENGITPGSNAVIKGNYIHDLQAAGADPHYDGIQVGGHPKVQVNLLIEGNTIIGRDNADVWITNDFGSITGVKVNHNQLLGKASGTGPNISLPVFTVYVGGGKPNGTISGITITNNIIQRGVYGFIDVDSASNVTISGNVDPLNNPIPVP